MTKERKGKHPKGSIGTPMRLLRVRKSKTEIAKEKERRRKAIHDVRHWRLPLIGEPYFIDPTTGQIRSGVKCPQHVLRALRRR